MKENKEKKTERWKKIRHKAWGLREMKKKERNKQLG